MRPTFTKEWWIVQDGEVRLKKGWAWEDDPDYFYFDVPVETTVEGWEQDLSLHVDDLFLSEEAARLAAIEWLDERIKTYQIRLAQLRGTNTSLGAITNT